MKRILFTLLISLLLTENKTIAQKNRTAFGINFFPLMANTLEVFPEYGLTANLSLRMGVGFTNNSKIGSPYTKYTGVKSRDVDGYFLKPGIQYSGIIPKQRKYDFFIGLSIAYSHLTSTTLKEKTYSSLYPRPIDTLSFQRSIIEPGIDLGIIFLVSKRFSLKIGGQSYYISSVKDQLFEKDVYYLPGLGAYSDNGLTLGFIFEIQYLLK